MTTLEIIIIILVVIILMLEFTILLFPYVIYRRFFRRYKPFKRLSDIDFVPEWKPYLNYLHEAKTIFENLNLEEITLTSFDGLKLNAYYMPASNPSNISVIAVHGYRSDCFQSAAIATSFLHQKDYNILYVELRGHGKSEGEYVGFGVQDHKDLLDWINYLDKRLEHKSSIFLHGLSMGANTVLLTSDYELPKSVKGIIADCGYTSVKDELSYLHKLVFHIPAWPFLPLLKRIVLKRANYSIDEYSTLNSLKQSKLPICFIHGDNDKFVPTIFSRENFEACSSEKELHIFPGAGHALSRLSNPARYEKIVEDFIKKHS